MSRLDDIRRAFEDGGCIQTEDARWLISQAEFAAEMREALEPFLLFNPSLFKKPPMLIPDPIQIPARVEITNAKYLPPENECVKIEFTTVIRSL